MSLSNHYPRPDLPSFFACAALLGLVLGFDAAPLAASDEATSRAEETSESQPEGKEERALGEIVHDRVTVLGTLEELDRLPGSAHRVGPELLERFDPTDIHRILSQVPGVTFQEEDGYGLRPNIGLRGTGVERSSKITLLEDGVPIAPAPYAAPAAYYSPTAGRMEALEVRKGSAAVRQGPHTQGGVINYVSTSIPGAPGGRVELSGGDFDTTKAHAAVGGTWATGDSGSSVGVLVEGFRHETSGFKDLDGGGDTGFLLEDVLAKVRWTSAPDAAFSQAFELKLGRTDQDGDETYLGLTAEDFARTPYRRYVSSSQDRFLSEHDAVVARWLAQPSATLDWSVTAYRNEFARNWYKGSSVLGTSHGSVLAAPDVYSDAITVLRGEVDSVDDAIRLRNNRRDYYSQGVEAIAGWRGLDGHDLTFGVRWHEDEEDRFQEEDGWAIRDGRMVLTSEGAPGSQANRIGRAEALAFYVEDEIARGAWTFVPGLRYETVDTERLDFGRDDPTRAGDSLATRENSFDAFLPGLGIHRDLGDGWGAFFGLHKGFSPPSPSSTREVDPEESLAWELGARFTGRVGDRATAFEAVAFFTDYSNLLGTDTLSGGGTGTGDQFNGGEVDVWGLELGLDRDLARGDGWRVPSRLAYTFSRGEFQSSFETSFADWAPEVNEGDELPYLPEHQVSAQVGLEIGAVSTFLAATWVDAMRTSAGTGAIPESSEIDSHWTVDLSASWAVRERFSLRLDVRNLTDEVYLAARRPEGLRPGLPRTATLGVSFDF